jgi:hypothetical protein
MNKGWMLYRITAAAALWSSLSFASAQGLTAHSFMAFVPPSSQTTHLIGIHQGSALSREVSGFRGQSFELSNGELVRFNRWYKTHWQDLQMTWMTEINPRWGLIWGLSTGERGPKYQIDPSLQLGFLFQQPLSKQSAWSVRATTRIGGRLKEKTCLADYGEIGGVQTVNCRLAATELPPEETLKYLLNEAPRDRMVIALRYVRQF